MCTGDSVRRFVVWIVRTPQDLPLVLRQDLLKIRLLVRAIVFFEQHAAAIVLLLIVVES